MLGLGLKPGFPTDFSASRAYPQAFAVGTFLARLWCCRCWLALICNDPPMPPTLLLDYCVAVWSGRPSSNLITYLARACGPVVTLTAIIA